MAPSCEVFVLCVFNMKVFGSHFISLHPENYRLQSAYENNLIIKMVFVSPVFHLGFGVFFIENQRELMSTD